MKRLPWGIFQEIVVEWRMTPSGWVRIYSASVKRIDGNSLMKVDGCITGDEAVDKLIDWVQRYYE